MPRCWVRSAARGSAQVTAGLPDYYMVAFHSASYIRAQWARFFDVVDIREQLIGSAHDAVILRRRHD